MGLKAGPWLLEAEARGLIRPGVTVAGPLAATPPPPAGCSEAGFMAWVTAEAGRLGWEVYHTRDSRRSAAGFPDLVLVRDGRLVFAELKKQTGRTTAAQERWLALLGAVPGVRAAVWRPDQWEAIAAELAAVTSAGPEGDDLRPR